MEKRSTRTKIAVGTVSALIAGMLLALFVDVPLLGWQIEKEARVQRDLWQEQRSTDVGLAEFDKMCDLYEEVQNAFDSYGRVNYRILQVTSNNSLQVAKAILLEDGSHMDAIQKAQQAVREPRREQQEAVSELYRLNLRLRSAYRSESVDSLMDVAVIEIQNPELVHIVNPEYRDYLVSVGRSGSNVDSLYNYKLLNDRQKAFFCSRETDKTEKLVEEMRQELQVVRRRLDSTLSHSRIREIPSPLTTSESRRKKSRYCPMPPYTKKWVR